MTAPGPPIRGQGGQPDPNAGVHGTRCGNTLQVVTGPAGDSPRWAGSRTRLGLSNERFRPTLP
jgi:hypothetical protein